MKKLQFIPPSPEIMSVLYMEYLREGKPSGMTFFQYLDAKGYSNPAHNLAGMDTGASFELVDGALDLIRIPKKPIHGQLHVKVLLIDFVDQPGQLPRQYYEDLLFSTGIHPRGSMRDYYHEVSLGKVDISGSVHGWLRMPEPYMFYTNNESGIFGETESTTSYPRNAQRMAEDAVRAAQKYQLPFESGLDKLDQGTITALFIVHAGRGAERLHPLIRRNEIWSHKWELKHPIEVAPGLFAVTYLTVPQECDLGVCAHELGHLAFQWQDFYDSNQAADGIEWSGSGFWDLMASGSYNGSSWSPAHPAGLHKSQHNWIDVDTITYVEGIESETRLEIKPYTATDGKVVKIISPHYNAGQYLLLENRTRVGFDTYLPGEGLLVWRVDESGEMLEPGKPGMLLIQADGLRQMEGNLSDGDAGDPFPGSTRKIKLRPSGIISTSFPDQPESGITLASIRHSQSTGSITLRVQYDGS